MISQFILKHFSSHFRKCLSSADLYSAVSSKLALYFIRATEIVSEKVSRCARMCLTVSQVLPLSKGVIATLTSLVTSLMAIPVSQQQIVALSGIDFFPPDFCVCEFEPVSKLFHDSQIPPGFLVEVIK